MFTLKKSSVVGDGVKERAKRSLANSRIPWLTRPSAVSFEETEMYNKILSASTSQGTFAKRQFFNLLNEIFPRFLPARYHAMDCVSLEMDSLSFWDSAALFLMSNQVFNPTYFHEIRTELQKAEKNPAENMHRLYTSQSCRISELLVLDECYSAEEFLLEPWVLVQLPFQPVLFYQWTVAVLAETLKLQRELVDFYTMEIPQQFGGAAEKLLMINQELLDFVHRSLCYFHDLSRGKVSKHFNAGNKQFIEDCEKILPAVKFVLGDKCKRIIRALKQLCWNGNLRDQMKDPGKVKKSIGGLCFDRFDVFFNRWFWESYEWREFLMKSSLRPEDDETPSRLAEKFSTTLQIDKIPPLETLQKLVSEKILEPGRLKGMPREKVLDAVDTMGNDLKGFYDMYTNYKGTSTEMGSSKGRDGGIILDIINLHSDVKVAEALSLMTQHILHCVSATGPNIYVDAVVCGGQEMTYEAIMKVLNKVQPSDNWSYEKIMRFLKKTLCSKPSMEQFQETWIPVKIAKHFEARIKKLVFTMIEQQFQSLPGTFQYNLEQQFVQYMLPCLVASILLVEKESTNQNQFKYCARLVNGILEAYEKEQYVINSPWSPSKSPYIAYKGKFIFYHGRRDMELRRLITCVFAPTSVEKVLLDHLVVHKSEGFHQAMMDGFPHHLYSDHCNVLAIQYYLLSCRFSHCVEGFGWFPKQLSIIDDKIMIGCCDTLKGVSPCATEVAFLRRYKEATKLGSCGDGPEMLLQLASPDLAAASEKLSMDQLLSLMVFYNVKFLLEMNRVEKNAGYDKLPFDDFADLVTCIHSHDWWKMKQILAACYKGRNFTERSLVSLKSAKKNLCYAEALKLLSPSGKLPMKEPGEVNFFPIQHCRWCGLAAVDDFKMCQKCAVQLDYPDIHFYCSKDCETRCLEKHSREHARFKKEK